MGVLALRLGHGFLRRTAVSLASHIEGGGACAVATPQAAISRNGTVLKVPWSPGQSLVCGLP